MSYRAYYRIRSDGDGDLIAILPMVELENIDQEEFDYLDRCIQEGFFNIFTVDQNHSEFPDTWSEKAQAFLEDDPMRPVESELRFRIANILEEAMDYESCLPLAERILNNIQLNFNLVEKEDDEQDDQP